MQCCIAIPLAEIGEKYMNKPLLNLFLIIIYILFSVNLFSTWDDEIENTELMIAVSENNINQVTKLLEMNASINSKNDFGLTAIRISIENKFNDITNLLIKHNALIDSQSVFIQSIYDENIILSKFLLDRGLNPEFPIYGKEIRNVFYEDMIFYPIHFAIKCKNYELTNLLIKHGANINNNFNITPLSLAVKINSTDILDLLLSNGVEINKQIEFADGSISKTSLHIAVELNNYEICKKLLDNNADPNLPEFNNGTYFTLHPLITALKNENVDIIRLLISYNADIKVIEKGYSMLDITKSLKNKEILKILKESGIK
jgi:ankyrin repeat protein